jgi:alkanesulfonate monooxygenase SsuD/methylene tetrahydromethanopterin reductase-like flavin-dependent oxidoreductase (luciferase family)
MAEHREAIVKVGLFLNTQFQPGQDVAAHVPDLVAQTRAARDAGFKSLWFPHHYLTGPLQMLQIVPMMAYLAQHAQGMRIGPNILILPLLNPVHVAEESATLDVLTGGNYVLGVGLGYREGEFTAFNMSLKERAPRLEEGLALIRRLWTGEKVTHKGRFYEVNDHAIGLRPVRDGGPPIWIAGTAEAAIKRAARLGDAWLIVPSTTLDELTAQMRVYRAALGSRAPDCFPMVRECYVGANHRTALEECRGALQYKYDAYASWGLSGRQNPAFEELVRDRFIIGDAVFVKEEIARYREALGIDHFMMRCHWPGLEFEKALGSIRRLGEIFA